MEKQSFVSAIEQICEEKGISKEKVIETIEMAMAAAYKKDYGKKSQIIRAKFDPETGQAKISQIKIVVDESILKPELTEEEATARPPQAQAVKETKSEKKEEEKKIRFNPEKHIMIEEAKKIKKGVKVGDEIEFPLETHKEYGRIAAQTAKQVIIQRIREAERESIYDEYKDKEGEIVSGLVQRIEKGNVFLDIGKTTGVLFPEEQIPGEYYRLGQRLRVYIQEVQKDPRGPVIILSRAHPKIVSKLFALEVPEISTGLVQIKSIAREPGARTKIAVASTEEGVDPIGSAVGQKGTRVQAVINELGGEKIDIIEWSEEPEKFIAQALAPAKVIDVELTKKGHQAKVIVSEEQFSLAIGLKGQNVRLAAKLTGWKIDVVSAERIEAEKKKEKKGLKKKTAKKIVKEKKGESGKEKKKKKED